MVVYLIYFEENRNQCMRELSVNWIYIPLNEIEDVLDSNQCVKLITLKQPTCI